MLVFEKLIMLTNMKPGPTFDQVSKVNWRTFKNIITSNVVGERNGISVLNKLEDTMYVCSTDNISSLT